MERIKLFITSSIPIPLFRYSLISPNRVYSFLCQNIAYLLLDLFLHAWCFDPIISGIFSSSVYWVIEDFCLLILSLGILLNSHISFNSLSIYYLGFSMYTQSILVFVCSSCNWPPSWIILLVLVISVLRLLCFLGFKKNHINL